MERPQRPGNILTLHLITSPVHFSHFFSDIYQAYDNRFWYVGAASTHCRRYCSPTPTLRQPNFNSLPLKTPRDPSRTLQTCQRNSAVNELVKIPMRQVE
jgi:hypothetical protein